MTILHGISINEPVTGVRPIGATASAIIGIVATATAAVGEPTNDLNAAFPIGQHILITDVRSALAKAGTGGTLAATLAAIADQGSPIVVLERVAVGNDAEATDANVIAGVQRLLGAESQLGVRPTILGAPGLDTQAVVEQLAIIAQRLRGFVYAACRPDGDLAVSVAEAVTYREEFSARELELIWPDTTAWDGHAVAIALGLRAMIDEREGWHRSLSNVAINGVTGLSHDVHFDIHDSSSDAGLLNSAPVTTLIRMNGYRFWGNRTTSDEGFFAFEVATRTAQALQDGLSAIEAQFIDRPLTVGLVRDMVESGNAYLRTLTSQGRIIGGKCWFDGATNPSQSLVAGKLTLDANYTYAAPMEGLTINLRVTSKYYDGFGDQLSAVSS